MTTLPQVGRLAVDADALAEMLSISKAMVFKLDAAGRLPRGLYLGRRRVWPVAEVAEWLRAGAPSRDDWEAKR
ncbi:MAG: AlpA family phage regulatory protein [Planctomycetes bacterium]|nr:AlpA family phage regulatory protein [Planctomycetota bacterium]